MANASSPAVALVQLSFQLDSSSRSVITTDTAELNMATILETIGKPARWHYQLQTRSSAWHDVLLKALAEQAHPRLQVRLGLASGHRQRWLPWQPHTLLDTRSVPYESGHTVSITSSDRLYELSIPSKTVARHGAISKLVADIASEASLDSVVEPTLGNSYSYVQSIQDDASFITRRLLPRAVNRRGEGGYLCYVRDGVLHFHTPGYLAELQEVSYFGDVNQGPKLTLLDQSQLMIQEGAASATYIMHDPYSGQLATTSSRADKLINLSKVTPPLSAISGANLVVPYHLGANRKAEADAMAQVSLARPYAKLYEAVLTLQQGLWVRLGDVVNLTVQIGSQRSPWSGLYVVREVQHQMNNGAISSSYRLARGELETTGNVRAGIPNIVVQDNLVSGRQLTVVNVSSSASSVTSTANTNVGGVVYTNVRSS